MKKETGIIILCLFSLSFSTACSYKAASKITDGSGADDVLHYAKGFRIVRHDGYTRVTVVNPWDTTQLLHDYLLVAEGEDFEIPDAGNVTRITVPLQSLAVTGAVHAGMLEMLDATTLVTGVAEPQYMSFDFVKEGVSNGAITNLGEAAALNIEKLIDISPDAIVVTTFRQANHGRLLKTGIPVIECVEYMENTPLGRAEWIKFLGVFTGKSNEADSIYNEIKKSYLATKALAQKAETHPTVFSEKKYRGSWDVPGGESYMAIFFRNAGADYIWKENNSTGSLVLPFEEVYAQAETADFWILKYYDPLKDLTYSELKSEYEPYALFNAWKNRNIFACNTAKEPYYEKGVMQPELILRDFVKIFHPEVMEKYEYTYFKPLP